jgi:hypothetical protein
MIRTAEACPQEFPPDHPTIHDKVRVAKSWRVNYLFDQLSQLS